MRVNLFTAQAGSLPENSKRNDPGELTFLEKSWIHTCMDKGIPDVVRDCVSSYLLSNG